MGGSARLPQRNRQVPPEGPQEAPADEGVALAVAKAENICSTFFEPQPGQTISPPFLPRINLSKTFPHFRQVYSKMGMRAKLGPWWVCFSVPAAPTGHMTWEFT
jgi:hypothetical protein